MRTRFQQSGYDEIEQERTGRRTTLVKSIIGFGTSMLAWGIGLKISRGVSHLINRKIGVELFRLSLSDKSPSHRFVMRVFNRAKEYIPKMYKGDRAKAIAAKLEKNRNLYLKLRDDIAQSIARMKETYVGVTAEFKQSRFWTDKAEKMIEKVGFVKTRKVPGVKRSFNVAELSVKDIRGTSIILNTHAAKKIPAIKMLNKIRASKALKKGGDLFAKARTSRYKISGDRFAMAMKARLYRYAVNVASGAPFEYLAYRMMTHDTDRERKGFVRSIGDYLKFRVTGDLVFGGAIGKATGFAMRAIKRHVVLPTSAKPIIKETLNNLSRLSNSAAVVSLHETAKDIRHIKKPTSLRELPKWISAVTDSFRKNYDKMLTLKPSERPTAAKSAINDALEIIKELNTIDKKTDAKSAVLKIMSVRKNIYENMRNNDPNKIISKLSWLFRKKGMKIRGAYSKEIKEALSRYNFNVKVSKDAYGALEKVIIGEGGGDKLGHFYNPRRGVISFGGKNYDLSNLMPGNITKTIANALGSISIFGIHPFRLLSIQPFVSLDDSFKTRVYRKGQRVFVGDLAVKRDPVEILEAVKGTVKEKPTRYVIKLGKNPADSLYYESEMYDRGASDILEAVSEMAKVRGIKAPNEAWREFIEDAATGHIKLTKNEEVWHIGKSLYYTPNAKAKNMKIFRMGFNFEKGVYETGSMISRENAGGLGILFDIYQGVGQYARKEQITRVKENDTWFGRFIHKIQDALDIGTYDRPSIFNKIGHFIRRFGNINQPRTYFSDNGVYGKGFMDAIIKAPKGKAAELFVKTTQQHLRDMQKHVVDTVFKRSNIITGIRRRMKEAGIEYVDPDDPFAVFDGFLGKDREKSYRDVIGAIRNRVRELFRTKRGGYSAITTRTGAARYLTPEEARFVNSLIRDDVHEIVIKQSISDINEAKYEAVKMFDNIRTKVFLSQMKAEELEGLINEISEKSYLSKISKDINALNIIKIFNEGGTNSTIDEILANKDVNNLTEELLGEFNNLLKDNRSLFEKYARYADPIWKMKGTISPYHMNSVNPQSDVFVADNVTAEGKSIRSFFDSIMPKMRKYQTPEGEELLYPTRPLTRGGFALMGAINAINNTAAYIGLGFSPQGMRTPTIFMKNVLTKRILPMIGLATAWRLADAFLDDNPLFDGTSIGQGLNVFTAEIVGKMRLGIARLNDITGVTASARYLEDLMPGSINSPLAGMIRGFGFPILGAALGGAKGGPKGGLIGGAIGLGLSLITAGGPLAFVGSFDLTKSRKDIIEEYAGRKDVPVYRGCLPEYAKVLYRDELGIVHYDSISKVKVGYSVFSRNNRWNKVNDVIPRKHSGLLYKIETVDGIGCKIDDNITTGNHLINAAKSEDLVVDYIRMDELKEGDYICFPLPESETAKESHVNKEGLWYINIIPLLLGKGNFVSKDVDSSMFYKPDDLLATGDGYVTAIYPYKQAYNIRTFSNKEQRFPATIHLTEKLGYIIGWWLSKGSYVYRNDASKQEGNKHTIRSLEFVIDSNREEHGKRILEYIKDIFGYEGDYVFVKDRNTMKLHVCNRMLITLFYSIFGRRKTVPSWFYDIRTNKFKSGVIQGAIDGDGYITIKDKESVIKFDSTNVSIIHYILFTLQSVNIIPSINISIPEQSNVRDNSERQFTIQITDPGAVKKMYYTFKLSYKISSLYKTKRKRYKLTNGYFYPKVSQSNERKDDDIFVKDGYVYVKIKHIHTINEKVMVYDLSVDNDPSFTGFRTVYHNSGWLFSSGPFGGEGIEFYKKSWFHLVRSQYRYAGSLYGDKLMSLINIFNPRYLAEKHKYSRPYPFCVLPTTRVVTNKGIKQIRDVKPGEYVWSSNANWNRVNDVLSREAHDETMVEIRVAGSPLKTTITEDHLVLAVKTKPCSSRVNSRRSRTRICRPNLKLKACKTCKNHLYEQYHIEWIKAGELEVGDLVVFPFPKHDESKTLEYIDLSVNNEEYLYNEKWIYGSKVGKKKKIIRFIMDNMDESKQIKRVENIRELSRLLSVNYHTLYDAIKRNQYVADIYPRYIPVEEDLAWFVGWYIAEGWNKRNHELGFALNINEIDIANRLIEIAKKYTLKYTGKECKGRVYRKGDTNGLCVDIYSEFMTMLVRALCFGDRADTKHINEDIYLWKNEMRNALLDGYISGDGHVRRNEKNVSSTSSLLIWQIRILFLMSGKLPNLSFIDAHHLQKLQEKYTQAGDNKHKIITKHDIWGILVTNTHESTHVRNGYIDGSNWFIPIRKIRKYKYSGKVYDLMVNNSHDFMASFIIHNSGSPLANIPIIGSMLQIGGGLQDYPEMKFALGLDEDGVQYSPTMDTMGLMAGLDEKSIGGSIPSSGFVDSSVALSEMMPPPMKPTSMPARIQAAFYGATEFAGLRGFLAQTAISAFNDGMFPYEEIPVYQSSALMSSPVRSWWDTIPSDPLGLGEFTRRMVPKRGEHVNEWNGLINATPSWLPGDDSFINYKSGDSFIKIRLGEVRLPGSAFEAVNDVSFTAPLEAEYAGKSSVEILAELTGRHMPVDPDERFDKLLSGKMAKQVAQALGGVNANIKMNQYVFNPFINMSGKFDIVIGGRHGMKVKVLTPETFSKLAGPRPQDTGEMNALLNLSRNINFGSIIYVNAATGDTKEFNVTKDPKRFQFDLARMMQVRGVALDLINEHGPSISKNLGNAYSRVDRLVVLSNVAPLSDEYRRTLQEVQTMDRLGMLSDADRRKVYIATQERANMMDRFRYTERKFTRGTPVTNSEIEKQRAIRASYSFTERTIGKLWENMTFSANLLTSKFINNATPIDVYRKNFVYSESNIRRWEHPYRDFIRPDVLSALNKPGMISSAIAMGTGGFVFGGPIGAGLGTIAGLGWGLIHGKESIPDITKRRRELLKQLDVIAYNKARMGAEMGDIDSAERMRRTMTYTFNNATSISQMISSLPKSEREFVRHFATSGTAEERERIMQLVPDYAQYVLQRAWAQGNEGKVTMGKDVGDNPINNVEMPPQTWAGQDPRLSIEDVSAKILEENGFNPRGVGLGYQAQQRRMLRNPYLPSTFDTKLKTTTPDINQMKSIITSSMPGARVSIMPSQFPGITLTVRGTYSNKAGQRESMRRVYGL